MFFLYSAYSEYGKIKRTFHEGGLLKMTSQKKNALQLDQQLLLQLLQSANERKSKATTT